jgi:hypothetical protein
MVEYGKWCYPMERGHELKKKISGNKNDYVIGKHTIFHILELRNIHRLIARSV